MGETKAVSVSQVFPVHRKGWPVAGVVDTVIGSPVSLPPCSEAVSSSQRGQYCPLGVILDMMIFFLLSQ